MGDASKLVTPKLDGKYHIYIYTYKKYENTHRSFEFSKAALT